MAERRMFSKTIIDSDLFLDMSLSAQALYFHLSMRADDEGFINSPKKIIRMINAHEDDFKVLIAKQFIIPFESGVVVVKHWKVHNYIRGDKKHETFHKLEKEQLLIDNDVYYIPTIGYFGQSNDGRSTDFRQPTDSQPTANCPAQDRLGKDRLGKDRLGKDNSENDEIKEEKPKKSKRPKKEEKISYAEFVLMKPEEYQKLLDQYGQKAAVRMVEILNNYKGSSGKTYKSDYMAILNWVVNRYEQENINNKNQNNKSEMAKFKSAYERAKEIDKAREMQEGRKSE